MATGCGGPGPADAAATAASPGRSRSPSGKLGRSLTPLAERAVLLIALALQPVERNAGLPAQVGAAERQHALAVVVRVLEAAEVDQCEHLLRDRDRAALEAHHVALQLLARGRQLGEH